MIDWGIDTEIDKFVNAAEQGDTEKVIYFRETSFLFKQYDFFKKL